MEQRALSFSPFTNTYTYDVFLSFRGEDTRTGFTGNLYNALHQRGILTFMDDGDDGLRKGEEIAPSLLNAIQKSRMAIIIFSKNYASSTFCLNELVQILECYTEKKMSVWPVFYDVDPAEVRHQRGSYGEALAKHEQGRFKDDIEKVQKWRLALHQVADLSGWHFKHGVEYEYVFIKNIIEKVSSKLNRPLLHIADYPVGLEARMQNLQSLIGPESGNEVNMLGIHGIGGIGKSTLARAMYNNLIAYQFEGSCFLANVSEKSTGNGLVQIQETVLSELAGERNIKLTDVNQGIPILKERLHRKKVLLILDDVDKKEQLRAIAGGYDWFGFGSIIIVTTRDKHLLDIHGVEKLYEVKEMIDAEARELFRWNAFKNEEVDPRYMEMIERAISYADGLPLALQTIGSNLFGKTLDEWRSAIEAYERIPNRVVQEILRVSYDGLEENEKEIFLDIACFFQGCTLKYVTNILHARGFQPKYGIIVLQNKSLIKIGRCNGEIIVTMHGLIQYMGKEIVRQQSTSPENRNRLWLCEDISRVVKKSKENDKIEAMMLDFSGVNEVQWNSVVFGRMENLMMLIKKKGCLFGSPKNLPNSLRVLEWWGYPAASLPYDFHSKKLVILNLSHSYFRRFRSLEESQVLSQLIFTGCECITQIPDISGFPNLTELCVDDCTNLITIHNSVGSLDKLLRFSAKGCTKLKVVPRVIKLTSLEYLCLRDCSSLAVFPKIVGPMEKLNIVDLEGTAIEDLPLSKQHLPSLQRLDLSRCKRLENKALSDVLQVLPSFFPLLKTLRLRDSNLTVLPECIEQCHHLELLDLCNCKQLREIRGLPPSIDDFLAYNCPSLKVHCSTLYMLRNQAVGSAPRKFCVFPGQMIPKWFDHTSEGNSLCFWFRKDFPSIAVSAVLGDWDNTEHPFRVNFIFYVKINDIEIPFPFDFNYILETDHVFMLNLFNYAMNVGCGGWSEANVLFATPPVLGCSGAIKWTGVYVDRRFTRMEDAQFTNPYGNPSMLPGENMLKVQPPREQFAFLPACWEQFLDNVYSNYVPGEASQVQRTILSIGEIIKQIFQRSIVSIQEKIRQLLRKICLLEHPVATSGLHRRLYCLPKAARISDDSNDRDEEFVDHQANFPGQSSQAPDSCSSYHKLATPALSEDANEALKILQDFISNDASVLLHRERCSVIEIISENISDLSADDRISTETRTMISEISREFTRWSRDYIKASMKIKSTASGVKASLGTDGNQLTRMKKIKKYLEEQIKVIECNISASQSEKKMTLGRERYLRGRKDA